MTICRTWLLIALLALITGGVGLAGEIPAGWNEDLQALHSVLDPGQGKVPSFTEYAAIPIPPRDPSFHLEFRHGRVIAPADVEGPWTVRGRPWTERDLGMIAQNIKRLEVLERQNPRMGRPREEDDDRHAGLTADRGEEGFLFAELRPLLHGGWGVDSLRRRRRGSFPLSRDGTEEAWRFPDPGADFYGGYWPWVIHQETPVVRIFSPSQYYASPFFPYAVRAPDGSIVRVLRPIWSLRDFWPNYTTVSVSDGYSAGSYTYATNPVYRRRRSFTPFGSGWGFALWGDKVLFRGRFGSRIPSGPTELVPYVGGPNYFGGPVGISLPFAPPGPPIGPPGPQVIVNVPPPVIAPLPGVAPALPVGGGGTKYYPWGGRSGNVYVPPGSFTYPGGAVSLPGHSVDRPRVYLRQGARGRLLLPGRMILVR